MADAAAPKASADTDGAPKEHLVHKLTATLKQKDAQLAELKRRTKDCERVTCELNKIFEYQKPP